MTTRASSGCEACFARRLRATRFLRVRSTRMIRATRSTKLQSTTRSATAFWFYRRCRACTHFTLPFCSSIHLFFFLAFADWLNMGCIDWLRFLGKRTSTASANSSIRRLSLVGQRAYPSLHMAPACSHSPPRRRAALLATRQSPSAGIARYIAIPYPQRHAIPRPRPQLRDNFQRGATFRIIIRTYIYHCVFRLSMLITYRSYIFLNVLFCCANPFCALRLTGLPHKPSMMAWHVLQQ